MATVEMKLWQAACVMFLANLVMAYPSGAPDGACGTLNPDTHGPSTATGPSPYTLTFSSNTYQPGQVLRVTLGGAMFKGFLIVGRTADSSSTDPVGYFIKPKTVTKIACSNSTTGNGLTHTNNTVKSDLTFDWRAPGSSVGDIVFHYTVVRGGAPNTKVDPADYFMDIKSPPLKAARQDLHFEEEATEEIILEVLSDDEDEEAMPKFEKILIRRPLP